MKVGTEGNLAQRTVIKFARNELSGRTNWQFQRATLELALTALVQQKINLKHADNHGLRDSIKGNVKDYKKVNFLSVSHLPFLSYVTASVQQF